MRNTGRFAGFLGSKLPRLIWIFPIFLAIGGCGTGGDGVVNEMPETKAVDGSVSGRKEKENLSPLVEISPPLPELKDRTTWDTCWIGGKKIGHVKTTVSRENRNGQEIVTVDSLNRLSVQRFGQSTEMTIQLISHQTSDGRMMDFESKFAGGSQPTVTKGRVEGNKLVLDVSTKGQVTTTSIPWSKDYTGPFGVEQMLLGNPMKPGQRRAIKILMPVVNQVVTTKLVACDYEPVELRSGTYRLLRIETETVLSNSPPMLGTIWTDRGGDTLKTFSQAMHQEIFRATKAEALDETDMGHIDLGDDMKIAVDRPLKPDEIDRQCRYKITIDGGDPAAMLVESVSQAVRSLGPNTAEVTVYALRPGDKRGNEKSPDDRPGREDIMPNSIIQSDDAKIVAMAKEAAGDLKDPWKIAVALEKFVKKYINEKDFTTAFATAAEVAQSRQGDCTEHAVLLAALARACDIPARGAMGLIYLLENQAFFYHMWTEVYVDNRWIPLDATIGRGGTGAERLKLAHSNLKGASAYSSFLPVAQVMGRMKIEVLDSKDKIEEVKNHKTKDRK
ncbi:MAG: transglutaminase domain-containing protein [Pirellulales bacterium]|nr:transglutaminase domain-containing protein [Pirellulales bacterium]